MSMQMTTVTALLGWLLTAAVVVQQTAEGKAITFYLRQQFGVNEVSNVAAAVAAVPPTRNGVGLQVVYNYPASREAPAADGSARRPLGFVRGTSVVVSNTANSTVFLVSNVFHYEDAKKNISGSFSQQGEADFASGEPWEFAVTGGTGFFRNVRGFSSGRVFSLTPVANASPIIVTKYRARLDLP
jgi:hypothetical protein